MRSSDLVGAEWRKSGRSGGGGEQTNCVEVAELLERIAVRDSKDPGGPVLAFTDVEWQGFLGGVRAGDFDLSPRVGRNG